MGGAKTLSFMFEADTQPDFDTQCLKWDVTLCVHGWFEVFHAKIQLQMWLPIQFNEIFQVYVGLVFYIVFYAIK